MNNRVVLITGASRGISAATAKLLGRHGAAVGVNYYGSEAAAEQVVEEIASEGGQALAVKADVRDCIIYYLFGMTCTNDGKRYPYIP
ncbi:hypothetical protein NUACC21_55740 [Scytonema sp. NUACC21]